MNTSLFRSGIPCALMATFVTGMCFSGGRFWFGVVMAALAVAAWCTVGWLWWKGFVMLLLLCFPAYAALPPMPSVPTVKRSAPLLSPKAASTPKSTPMTRFTPAGESTLSTLAPCFVTFTIDQFFFDQIVDITHLQSIQRANKGNRFEFKDSTAPGGWAFIADWAPDTVEHTPVVEWYHSTDQRRPYRFFRVVEYTEPALLTESGSWVLAGSRPAYRVNPALKGIRTWRTVRK